VVPPVAPQGRAGAAFTDTIQVSEQPVDRQLQQDDSRHQEMLGITGTKRCFTWLTWLLSTNLGLGGHVQAGDQVTGEDLPRLDTIISDAIWSNHSGMDWDLSMNHTALPSIERGDGAFQFLADGQLPGLGPLEGDSPADDLQNVEAMNRMSTETSASPSVPLQRLSRPKARSLHPDHRVFE
jgi:hypothetical protein